jgi:hypothetical protein
VSMLAKSRVVSSDQKWIAVGLADELFMASV